MTAVEFYDRTPIENVISSLTTVPDRIIFIGDGKLMKKFDPIYRTFLEERGLSIELAYRNIKKNDLNNIIEVLSDIVETEDSCVFDLTGGEDLVLVAMGIVFERYSEKNIQMQRFNVRNGVVTDCDNDGTVLYSGTPMVSVEENVRLHGGVIRYQDQNDDRTFRWELSDDFVSDVEKMWSVCRANPGLWNTQINILEAFDVCGQEPSLDVSVNVQCVREYLQKNGIKYVSIKGLLRALNQKGLISSYADDGQTVSFTYKNKQVKRCLIKAGTVLELKVLITANRLTDKEGVAFYSDSMNGVYIDWDGSLHDITDEEKDTENEIDVVLMKGLTPIFISCKNGKVDDDELYKLEAVTDRFGGLYAKKVLIATYLGKKAKSMEYFRQRAKDMRINLIDGVHELSDTHFSKMVKHLINS